jgi:hypothetical protein
MPIRFSGVSRVRRWIAGALAILAAVLGDPGLAQQPRIQASRHRPVWS